MSLKRTIYVKVFPGGLSIGGLFAFIWGSNQVQSFYRLLYSFSGADGSGANPVALGTLPSNIWGYLYLSYAGIFVVIFAQWLKKFAERELKA